MLSGVYPGKICTDRWLENGDIPSHARWTEVEIRGKEMSLPRYANLEKAVCILSSQ